MATYKLIQDIEAEDHILGPLSLRQFIFGLVAAFCWYLCFVLFVRGLYFLLPFTLLPALFSTFFTIPFGRDQPTEVWALAKLRFWFKPRRRIWDQSGVKELVTITVPKKVEHILTNGLSQNEVESRLKVLATTLDSRGWAVKNATLGGTYAQSNLLAATGSDRLLDIGAAPVPSYDVPAADDILDEANNPVARQFESMITQSSQQHRQQLLDELNGIRSGQPAATGQDGQANYWFMNRGGGGSMPAATITADPPSAAPRPQPAADSQTDAALSAQLKAQQSSQDISNAHLRTLQPLGAGTQQPPTGSPAQTGGQQAAPAVTAPPDPAILSLANNDDLNVSTLAREAYKAKHGDEPPQDEVVISLR